jgi:hypothetical protein
MIEGPHPRDGKEASAESEDDEAVSDEDDEAVSDEDDEAVSDEDEKKADEEDEKKADEEDEKKADEEDEKKADSADSDHETFHAKKVAVNEAFTNLTEWPTIEASVLVLAKTKTKTKTGTKTNDTTEIMKAALCPINSREKCLTESTGAPSTSNQRWSEDI